jgi:hypothetical protein
MFQSDESMLISFENMLYFLKIMHFRIHFMYDPVKKKHELI